MHTHTRLAWLRLNADGLLLAGLALAQGLDLIDPTQHDLAVRLGFVPPLFYLWTVLYLAGGGMLLVGLAERRTDIELIGGRLLICLAASLETWRIATVYGWVAHMAIARYVVLAIVIGTCALRATALLPKETVHVIIPPRRSR